MQVVAQCRLVDLVDGEVPRHESRPIIEPVLAVIVVCLTVLVVAAQERSADDSATAMLGANFLIVVNVVTHSASHRHLRGSWLFQFGGATAAASTY